ncbi:hypothetical protein [Halocola ammonii]
MIDLHLLTRITRDDYSFLSMISQKICNSNDKFRAQFDAAMQDKNWNHCYFLLLEFFKKTSAYSTGNFKSAVQNTLDTVKISDSNESRKMACENILQRIQDGTDNLKSRFPSPTVQD